MTENKSLSPGGDKTAFCTVLSDPFVIGFAVLAHSLQRQHPGISIPFHIFHHPILAHLSDQSKELLSGFYPNIVYHEVDADRYEAMWQNRDSRLRTPQRLRSAFFVIEAFSLEDYDRVIALDSDMVITGDLNELLDHPADFGVTRAIDYDNSAMLDFFNTGVMVIGRAHLTGATYKAILAHQLSENFEIRKGKADQAILNDFFGSGGFIWLNAAYNVTKRKFPDDTYACVEDLFGKHLHILHFVAGKPWEIPSSPSEERYSKLEAYWAKLLSEVMDYGTLYRHMRVMYAHSSKGDLALQRQRNLTEKTNRSLAKARTFHHRERMARIKDVRIQTSRAEAILNGTLDQIQKSVSPPPGTKLVKRLASGFVSGVLRKRVSAAIKKSRERWAKHYAALDERLTRITPKEEPPAP